MKVLRTWDKREEIGIGELIKDSAYVKIRKHLAVEIGGRKALSKMYELIRRIKRIGNYLGEDEQLHVFTTNNNKAPSQCWDWLNGIAIVLWCVDSRENRILWEIVLWSNGTYRIVGVDSSHTLRFPERTDLMVKRIKKLAKMNRRVR